MERERKLRNGHACIQNMVGVRNIWREKEEKNMDACIHAGISHGLACEKYVTWCAESFLSIKSIFSSCSARLKTIINGTVGI